MVINVNGPGSIKAADKSKAKAKTSATGGPSFADMLEEAQGAAPAETTPSAPAMSLPAGYVPLEDYTEENRPQNPRQQAQELLKTLQSLAEDALSGSPTSTISRLEELTASMDESALTQAQKDALDEARTRAAVEVAKLKG